MDYERVHKLQSGIISPSKLRMKLMGPHHSRKKDGSSNTNTSSRTSPSSRLDDTEFVNDSLLLDSSSSSIDDEQVSAPSIEALSVSASSCDAAVVEPAQLYQTSSQVKEPLAKENGNLGRSSRTQQFSKGESTNSSAVHPMRLLEDENLDYDSNASSSSFEFHKERTTVHNNNNQFTRSFSRPMPSKWNDAEKWIMSRQNIQPTNYSKKNSFYNQAIRMPGGTTNLGRVAPESTINRVADTKRIDFCQPSSQLGLEKFSFTPPETPSISGQAYEGNVLIDQCTQSKDLTEANQTKTSADDPSVVSGVRSVCMRDMGTEMTPVTSQEPSRTATPTDATTPFRSPTSSIPSTPRRGEPTSTPAEHLSNDDKQPTTTTQNGKKELTEQEMKLKTRREIVALGVQLGKMNIAAWASKEDQEKNASNVGTADAERIEYEKRAAAWDEAEKSKHAARYKREEIKIQAWESQQKAKLEAEMRKIEARMEQMKAQGEAKMVKKIALARQRSEEKRVAAEARKRKEAERTSTQAEYIRKTGRMPPSSSRCMCCGWL